jgi:hypothetical protein
MVLSAMERGLRQAGRFEPAWSINNRLRTHPIQSDNREMPEWMGQEPADSDLIYRKTPHGLQEKNKNF